MFDTLFLPNKGGRLFLFGAHFVRFVSAFGFEL
jgi:hypothetical protein